MRSSLSRAGFAQRPLRALHSRRLADRVAKTRLRSLRSDRSSSVLTQRRRSAVSTDVPLDVDRDAASRKTELPNVGLVFSPGGFLVSYYLGVIECLREMRLVHEQTPMSGTSAGALAAAFAVSGLSTGDCTSITREIQGRLLESNYGWKVVSILQKTLNDVLPEDVHLRATDRIGIGLTIYSKKRHLAGKVLTRFQSRREFVDAVVASCYIPFYLGPSLGIEWSDGDIYSDGMPTNFFPDFPSDFPAATDHTITVSAFPAANRRIFDNRGVDISPDRRPRSEIPSVWKTLWNGLVPLRMEEVDAYRQKGYDDTVLWADHCTDMPELKRC